MMDPTVALENILRGNEVSEHAEALQEWIGMGGFLPIAMRMPARSHELFAAHCERQHGCKRGYAVRVKANARGVWTTVTGEDWFLAADWKVLADAES